MKSQARHHSQGRWQNAGLGFHTKI